MSFNTRLGMFVRIQCKCLVFWLYVSPLKIDRVAEHSQLRTRLGLIAWMQGRVSVNGKLIWRKTKKRKSLAILSWKHEPCASERHYHTKWPTYCLNIAESYVNNEFQELVRYSLRGVPVLQDLECVVFKSERYNFVRDSLTSDSSIPTIWRRIYSQSRLRASSTSISVVC